MKLTLANIKKIKNETDNKLTKKVCNYVINEWNDYSDKKCIFTDVLNYGCQSGMVSELIYYSQTTAFYKRYQNEINELIHDIGIYNMAELFGKRWDTEDTLALDTTNQNLLAWFGFEEALRNVGWKFECLQEVI